MVFIKNKKHSANYIIQTVRLQIKFTFRHMRKIMYLPEFSHWRGLGVTRKDFALAGVFPLALPRPRSIENENYSQLNVE